MYDAKFGTIKGLSDRRRLPLLGKIRLGIKKKTEQGKEYPSETEYFVCPPEVQKVFGEKPKILNIMLPVAQRHVVFPQAYRWYGSGKGLKCIGNGEVANRFSDDKKSLNEIECPCEKLQDIIDPEMGKVTKKAECKQRAFLMVMLPDVNMGGVYQVSTGAYNSIVDINSGLDYIEALIGRIQMVPIKLFREPITTHNEGMPQKHYTLKVRFEGDVNFLNQLRENTKRILLEGEKIALPAPQDENPALDPVDEVEGQGITDAESKPSDVVDTETGEIIQPKLITAKQIKSINGQFDLLKKDKDWDNDKLADLLIKKIGKSSFKDITYNEAETVILAMCMANKVPPSQKK